MTFGLFFCVAFHAPSFSVALRNHLRVSNSVVLHKRLLQEQQQGLKANDFNFISTSTSTSNSAHSTVGAKEKESLVGLSRDGDDVIDALNLHETVDHTQAQATSQTTDAKEQVVEPLSFLKSVRKFQNIDRFEAICPEKGGHAQLV